jgi:hypothetical protein
VGSGGSAINRIREALGVSIVFEHDSDETQKDTTKKKKVIPQKAHVKVSTYYFIFFENDG